MSDDDRRPDVAGCDDWASETFRAGEAAPLGEPRALERPKGPLIYCHLHAIVPTREDAARCSACTLALTYNAGVAATMTDWRVYTTILEARWEQERKATADASDGHRRLVADLRREVDGRDRYLDATLRTAGVWLVQCAWCQATVSVTRAQPGDGGMSHGCCHTCAARELGRLPHGGMSRDNGGETR